MQNRQRVGMVPNQLPQQQQVSTIHQQQAQMGLQQQVSMVHQQQCPTMSQPLMAQQQQVAMVNQPPTAAVAQLHQNQNYPTRMGSSTHEVFQSQSGSVNPFQNARPQTPQATSNVTAAQHAPTTTMIGNSHTMTTNILSDTTVTTPGKTNATTAPVDETPGWYTGTFAQYFKSDSMEYILLTNFAKNSPSTDISIYIKHQIVKYANPKINLIENARDFEKEYKLQCVKDGIEYGKYPALHTISAE